MNNYPSTRAMKAAVELEILNAIGSIQTVGIGDLVQKVINATIDECADIAQRETCKTNCASPDCLTAKRIAGEIRALRSPQGTTTPETK